MRHTIAPIAGAVAVLAATFLFLIPAGAHGRTALAELRVEGPAGALDPGTWYVTGSERIRKSKPGDACVRTRGRIAVPGPTAIGLVESARATNRRLNQVRVRRDQAGLFVCEIGSIIGRPFTDPDGFAGWSYYEDWVFGSAAADQVRLRRGDAILWVFSDFGVTDPVNTGPALELRRVPPRAEGPFVARVVEHGFDGSVEPASGATIHGAAFDDLGGGRYRVFPDTGESTLWATRNLDIASNRLTTCSRAKARSCPAFHGRAIVGSSAGDALPGTRGWDTIKARGGRDRIDLRRGGRDRVNCGGGRDVVLLRRGDRDDRLRNCERVRRG